MHPVQLGGGAMQVIRECQLRATILTTLAKATSEPEIESQLLYLAQEWLTVAALREQLIPSAELGGSLRHYPIS
jgi:hypothetical protein